MLQRRRPPRHARARAGASDLRSRASTTTRSCARRSRRLRRAAGVEPALARHASRSGFPSPPGSAAGAPTRRRRSRSRTTLLDEPLASRRCSARAPRSARTSRSSSTGAAARPRRRDELEPLDAAAATTSSCWSCPRGAIEGLDRSDVYAAFDERGGEPASTSVAPRSWRRSHAIADGRATSRRLPPNDLAILAAGRRAARPRRLPGRRHRRRAGRLRALHRLGGGGASGGVLGARATTWIARPGWYLQRMASQLRDRARREPSLPVAIRHNRCKVALAIARDRGILVLVGAIAVVARRRARPRRARALRRLGRRARGADVARSSRGSAPSRSWSWCSSRSWRARSSVLAAVVRRCLSPRLRSSRCSSTGSRPRRTGAVGGTWVDWPSLALGRGQVVRQRVLVP